VTGPAGKKRGLGRGLDALIEKTEPKPDEPVRALPVASLHPNRFQPRTYFDEAAIEDLVASVRAQGIIQPLVVTPEGEGYAIIAGERRWRAARKAGLEAVYGEGLMTSGASAASTFMLARSAADSGFVATTTFTPIVIGNVHPAASYGCSGGPPSNSRRSG
jgi:hypothetical protein